MPECKTTMFFYVMTPSELQSVTGIGKQRWSAYFSGRSFISVKNLMKAAKALGMDSGELLNAIQLRSKLKEESKKLLKEAKEE